ncbi:GntR family transcriptional regulator [Proteiniborus ethanoligenes]|uniref:GntR family transcriptional regulator n=1 Tax=Proteiniborus ethanoligenes TaxID=415015 RepID=A0A1H3MBY1_9FIRM|nr:GntR family transcriptional regulator [Proteiniborus ethanoligenes]TAH62945.1 MAG: GntR family transcriptional regulator [Gottschalkiaceae bacterium]SDY74106.1 GntR family transcriptional regulator [Proteiniborus ethanoligenes]
MNRINIPKVQKQTAVQQALDYLRNYILTTKNYEITKLPSEAQLASKMGISRLTVREALIVLENEGLITRSQGSSTMITTFARKLSEGIDYAGELGRFIDESGYESTVDIISYAWESCNEEDAEKLDIELGDQVLMVKKKFLANGKPAAYCINRVPKIFLDNNKIKEEDLGKSMFDFVEEACNCQFSHDFMEIIPSLVTKEIKDILGLEENTPILRVDVIKYTVEGCPVMYNTEYYVDNLIRFTACRTMPYIK